VIVAIGKRALGQGAEGNARGIIGKEEVLLRVWGENILYGQERTRGVEDQEIGELVDRTCEKSNISEQIEDMPEDGN